MKMSEQNHLGRVSLGGRFDADAVAEPVPLAVSELAREQGMALYVQPHLEKRRRSVIRWGRVVTIAALVTFVLFVFVT